MGSLSVMGEGGSDGNPDVKGNSKGNPDVRVHADGRGTLIGTLM